MQAANLSFNPESLKLADLPSVSLLEFKRMPNCQAIYLAVESNENILYIGRSKKLRSRWNKHHKKEDLIKIGDIRIFWIYISDLNFLILF